MQKIDRILRENSGFTLIEVVVAIALTTLLAGFAFGVYLLGETWFVRWQRKMRVQNEVHVAAQTISRELFHADSIVKMGTHGITIQTQSGRIKRFYLKGHSLMVDSLEMTDDNLQIVDFQCHADADSVITDSTGTTGIRGGGALKFVAFTISAVFRKDTLNLRRSVRLRRQSYWKPL